jgi:hypothetical protein
MNGFDINRGGSQPVGERRSGTDRRRVSMPHLFSRQVRRRSGRRRAADLPGYVDIYDFRSWAIALSILVLSLLDAFLTWAQIAQGRVGEANPLMHAVLRRGGPYTFYGFKTAMTALPLAIIMLHKEWALARFAARLCLWSYILIALYHIYLVCI